MGSTRVPSFSAGHTPFGPLRNDALPDVSPSFPLLRRLLFVNLPCRYRRLFFLPFPPRFLLTFFEQTLPKTYFYPTVHRCGTERLFSKYLRTSLFLVTPSRPLWCELLFSLLIIPSQLVPPPPPIVKLLPWLAQHSFAASINLSSFSVPTKFACVALAWFFFLYLPRKLLFRICPPIFVFLTVMVSNVRLGPDGPQHPTPPGMAQWLVFSNASFPNCRSIRLQEPWFPGRRFFSASPLCA